MEYYESVVNGVAQLRKVENNFSFNEFATEQITSWNPEVTYVYMKPNVVCLLHVN